MNVPHSFWRIIKFGPRIAYALGLGSLFGRMVLLLTTVGRKTGRPRVTPLVYDQQGDTILVASARGARADWFRNIQANPSVHIRIGRRQLAGMATVVTDPDQIADYLERQFQRSPRMFGAILRSEGLPSHPSRGDLLALAARRPMIALRPADHAP